MKKAIIPALVITFLYSCGNTNNKTDGNTSVNRPGVENVNGNLPETQNSIPLDSRDTIASKDSSLP